MSSLVAFQCEEGGDFPSVSLFHLLLLFFKGTDGGSVVKSPSAHAEDIEDADLIPGLGRFPWRRKWQPTPVFLPENSHRQRSLEGYSPWTCKQSNTTEHARWIELEPGSGRDYWSSLLR